RGVIPAKAGIRGPAWEEGWVPAFAGMTFVVDRDGTVAAGVAANTARTSARRPFRWHIAIFLAPAVVVYSAFVIIPLVSTRYQSFFSPDCLFAGLGNFVTLSSDPRLSASFWNALWNNVWFFIVHMLVQNPIGILLAALLSIP